MEYSVKIRIGSVEIFEAQDLAQKTPYITAIQLTRSTSLAAMAIGSSASDSLRFTMFNPYKTSFDGDKIELFVKAKGDTSTTGLGAIEEAVGSDTTEELIDNSDVVNLYDDTEEGEPLSPEDMLDIAATELQNIEDTYEFFTGEPAATIEITPPEGEAEGWTKLGSFYVYKQTNSQDNNSVAFECLDGFMLLGEEFEPRARRATVQTIYNDFVDQVRTTIGLEVDEFEFDDVYNVPIEWKMPTTFRQAIEYFAGLVGGFAVIGDDDTLGISFYTYNDTIILDTSVSSFVETSAGEMYFDAVACDRSISPYRTDVIEAGSGQGVKFANPFVTQEMLDDILALYKGVRYMGAVAVMSWNDTLQSGQFVRIMSPDEYRNFVALNNALQEATDRTEIMDKLNTLGKVLLISNQVINFAGDATAKVQSICNTEFEKANPATSPTTGVFKQLYAEMIDADQIITNRLEAAEAIIADLDVEHLKAQFADIELANVAQLTAQQLDALKANLGILFAEVGLLSTAVIEEGHVTGYLDAVQINANSITAGTLEVERLIVTDEDGDQYMIHFEDGEAISQKLEGNIMRERSITADRILANSITAAELTASNIMGANGWINLSDGTFNYSNTQAEGFGNGISWDGSKLRIKADALEFSSGGAAASQADVDDARRRADAYLEFNTNDGLIIGDRRSGAFTGTTARLKSNQLGFYPSGSNAPVCYIGQESDAAAWGMHIEKGIIDDDLSFGQYQWITRDNGNMSLKWKG